MSYIQDNLMPNEKIIFTARVHSAVFLPSVLMLIISLATVFFSFRLASQQNTSASMLAGMVLVIAFFLFLYAVVLSIKALITVTTTEFAVTNRRIFAKSGLIRRHTLEILLLKVESVEVYQNIIGRLLNYGTVSITGTGGTSEEFEAIVDPSDVRKKVNQVVEYYTAQAYAHQHKQ